MAKKSAGDGTSPAEIMAGLTAPPNGAATDDDTDGFATVEDLLEGKAPASFTATVRTRDGRTVKILLEACGRKAWADALNAHPATDDQQAEYIANQVAAGANPAEVSRLRWNPDTFPPVAIALSAARPSLDVDQARRLWNGKLYSAPELDDLFSAAVMVNEQTTVVSLGKDWDRMLALLRKSQPPTTSESPTPSS